MSFFSPVFGTVKLKQKCNSKISRWCLGFLWFNLTLFWTHQEQGSAYRNNLLVFFPPCRVWIVFSKVYLWLWVLYMNELVPKIKNMLQIFIISSNFLNILLEWFILVEHSCLLTKVWQGWDYKKMYIDTP